MRILINILVFSAVLFFFSCTEKNGADVSGKEVLFSSYDNTVMPSEKEKLDATDYVKWLENDSHGLKINKKMGKFTFTSLYKPYEYLALQEMKSKHADKKILAEKIKEYSGLQYFTFRISAEGQSEELLKVDLNSENEYASRIEYFSFNMQKDLKLIDGIDTLDCSLFHFERVYGLAPYATFVLGFPLTKSEERVELSGSKPQYQNKTLLYSDQVFGSGNIYMTTKAESLNNLPELITN